MSGADRFPAWIAPGDTVLNRHQILSIRNPHAHRQIKHTIIRSRFGYRVHTTYGIANVGEAPMFSFTRKRAERKAQRLADRIRRNERRRAEAQEITR